MVSPTGQPFAFSTHCGKVRRVNQDTALVLAGRHPRETDFLAATVCDGLGGLENGDEAAILAAAAAGAVLTSHDHLEPTPRMHLAIRMANAAVFQRFRGRAASVIVSVLTMGSDVVIGWLGDARIYGLTARRNITLLTQDDTVAGAIAALEGSAPDAMDTLLQAVGQSEDVEPHVLSLTESFRSLLLVTDGVHRIDATALRWIVRHAATPTEIVQRLVAASSWEGGTDNATALALDLDRGVILDDDEELLTAWAENEPRTWQVVHGGPVLRGRPEHVSDDWFPQRVSATSSAAARRRRRRGAGGDSDDKERARPSPEPQPPLSIELLSELTTDDVPQPPSVASQPTLAFSPQESERMAPEEIQSLPTPTVDDGSVLARREQAVNEEPHAKSAGPTREVPEDPQ